MSEQDKEATPDGDHLTEILKDLTEKNCDPVLVECGPFVMGKYFESLKKSKSENLIDGVYIAFFEGILSVKLFKDIN